MAPQFVGLLDEVLLGLGGQSDSARRNTPDALVAHVGQPRQLLVELLVLLVIGEVSGLDAEEVGERGHGGHGRIRPIA